MVSRFSNFENGTHFTISVQSAERNVPLVSGTNMIFDIKTVAITLNAYDYTIMIFC